MVDYTFEQLSKRINDLELILLDDKNDKTNNIGDINDNKTISSQINHLKSQLFKLYQQYPEFQKLNNINSQLKIWHKLLTNTSITTTPIDQETKLELLNLLYDDLINNDNYEKIISIINFQYESIINGINNNYLSSLGSINDTGELLQSKRNQLNQIMKIHQALIIKSMIVLERYIQCTIRQNKFWIDIDDQLIKINAKIKQLELSKLQANKY
ncbi:conserved hypothetical protein [Candida dubliniensis CD36]|uniref:Uncharacterized protein n=1 Tax=Candida dubliniensis (strain CD36 / ATCC MYA-646 / CBS 7987 / NCPF 3949 / NRRL Y-17841) TaxID=573826 RepID=B9W9Q6_CANDC|nr:conserved hypothetical protein [Candida dubliniensis CD36]CAX45542.1 conserved hypothetical protein [Candida dubliniensis CD36]